MATRTVNRRGPKRSQKSLAAERATTTRRIVTGRFTAPPPIRYVPPPSAVQVISSRPTGPVAPVFNPFPGFQFQSPVEFEQAVRYWTYLGRPPTDGRWMPLGDRWFLVCEYLDDNGVRKTGGLYFDVFPTIGDIIEAMAEQWSGDPRYPQNPQFVRVTLVRYRRA